MGRHAIYVGPEGIATIIKWITITSYISIVLVVATKYAIVILLCKIMAPSRPGRWFLWGLMGLLTVVAVIAIALVSVECVPLERLWNPFLPGSCGLLNVAANFAIFTGGKCDIPNLEAGQLTTVGSSIIFLGSSACSVSHKHSLEPPDQVEEEDRYLRRYGLRCSVYDPI